MASPSLAEIEPQTCQAATAQQPAEARTVAAAEGPESFEGPGTFSSGLSLPLVPLAAPAPILGANALAGTSLPPASARHELAALDPQSLPSSGALSLADGSCMPQLHAPSYPLEAGTDKALAMAMAPSAQPGPSSFVGQLLGPDSVMIPAPETGAPQAPRDPTIVTVQDRRVRDRDFYGRTPLYVLVRRWLQNDPNLEPLPIMPEPQNAPVLPPPLPQPAEADPAAPSEAPFPFDKSSGNAEGLMEWHRSHWLTVRQHARVKASKKKSRYKQRMQLLNSHAQAAPGTAPA